MRFKIDENLPVEAANLLREAGYDAITVTEQQLDGVGDVHLASVCRQEDRALITLDTGFADIRTYSPTEPPGLIVLRLRLQSKPHVLTVLRRVVNLFSSESLGHALWIVDEANVRIRSRP